jgi:hydrogenase expression/formation protein HypD
MKFIDEFRDAKAVKKLAGCIQELTTKSWTLMEVCGGQTHSLIRYGIDTLLPDGITLIHGPGCPVCVTPVEQIDKSIDLALRPGFIFCSFGDMLRVPGSEKDLLFAKAKGSDIRIVYSPTDAVTIAQKNPDKEVIFFAVGFETTAPANAMAVFQASKLGLKNFSILCSHVLVPPAMEAILSSPENLVQGFLAAGHVCTIMGEEEYRPLAEKYQVPIVVTGFEPFDLLQGIYHCVKQLEEGRFEVENQYDRSVRKEGNLSARKMIEEVFEVIPRKWRGIGSIPQSGLGIRSPYSTFDAETRYDFVDISGEESPECVAGQILQGLKKPNECPAFGTRCTPEHPLGAPMVSSEGACSAYYNHRSR